MNWGALFLHPLPLGSSEPGVMFYLPQYVLSGTVGPSPESSGRCLWGPGTFIV